ncbi:helix-turn-helix domain-containing protein [Bacteroidota bacterium]
MESIFLQSVSVSELKELISETIQEQIGQIQKPQPKTELLTRKEAAEILGISLPTLHYWTKDGKVPAYRIGNRVRYKRNEVLSSLQKIQV